MNTDLIISIAIMLVSIVGLSLFLIRMRKERKLMQEAQLNMIDNIADFEMLQDQFDQKINEFIEAVQKTKTTDKPESHE